MIQDNDPMHEIFIDYPVIDNGIKYIEGGCSYFSVNNS